MKKTSTGRLRGLIATVCSLAVAGLCGCNGPGPDSHITRIQQLEDRLADESRQRTQCQERLAEQAKVIQRIQGTDSAKRLDQLVHVARIEVDRLSGGFDDDHNGVSEGVVVYLRMFDQEGDVIKAAGSTAIRVVDLSSPGTPQVLGEGHWSPEEMKPLWYGRFMTSHYTLRVPWAGASRSATSKSVTVAATFTDLLTGQSFEAQKVIALGASPNP